MDDKYKRCNPQLMVDGSLVVSGRSGDIFILVYSIDNRESFEEVKRLQQQVWESKGCSPTVKPRRRPTIPMMLVGNKCDRESNREIVADELKALVDGIAGCGAVETSAKKNVNIEEVFLKLFMLAQLPTEMSPSLHRKVQPSYVGGVGTSGGSFRRGVTIRRRLSDACGAIAPNARRPSIRTDLLNLQTSRGSGTPDKEARVRISDGVRCVLQ